VNSLVLVVALSLLSLAASTAPLLNADSRTVIPDQYLVVFHTNVSVNIRDFHVHELRNRLSLDEVIIDVFSIGTLIGYSARLSKENLVVELEDSKVRYIEADQVVTIVEDMPLDEVVQRTGVTWGLDRVDQRALPLNNIYSYWATAGSGVDAYIIDTGVYGGHNEFTTGRVIQGTNTVPGESPDDCHGHGTHVAGTVAGNIYGMSNLATVIAVKVLSCAGSGSWAGVIQGVQWVTNSASSRGRPSVANMSLGGGATQTVDDAVRQSIIAGVNYAIAAGNSNANACLSSPARVTEALTAGATDRTDMRASFSNIGTCMDLFAPGVSVTSAWIGSSTATNTISGTSMASPHVCGAVSQALGHNPTLGNPTQVAAWINAAATPNIVGNPGTGSPNRLLYSPIAD